jgi:hypothetical protein
MIFQTNDPINRSVILKKSTWEDKILNINGANTDNIHGNSHTEMEGLLDGIKKSIEKPIYILNDTGISTDESGNDIEYINRERQEYYTFNFDSNFCLRAIKTVVDFSKDVERGEIVTTHIMTGPIKKIKSKGGVVYDSTCE